jgi:Cft2 family RNA processing exonuclease
MTHYEDLLMFEYKNGIHIKGTSLWLDARRKVDLSFVSHAHVDHAAKHNEILSTKETVKFYEHRWGKAKFHILEYNHPKSIEGLKVELFPSGHILGGAQILIEKGGIRLVYTGDFKLRGSLTAQKAEIKKCDILILESTFGLPHYVFPPVGEVHDRMADFVETTRKEGKIPIFLAYSLGKAQEAMRILSKFGYQLSVHGTISPLAKIYEDFGIKFNNWKHYHSGNLEDRVLIVPPWVKDSRMIDDIPRKRMAMLTGWAIDTKAKSRFGVDEAIPLSDHADFSELMEYARKAKPEKIYTVHGFPEFVYYLKEAGFDAEPLKESTKVKTLLCKELLANYDLFT